MLKNKEIDQIPFDEFIDSDVSLGYAARIPADVSVRAAYHNLKEWLQKHGVQPLRHAQREADLIFKQLGITFAVYGDAAGTERTIPIDMIPRIIARKEWLNLEKGLKQRVSALNHFISDIYHERAILRAKRIPEDVVLNNSQYRPVMQGVKVPHKIYSHISGIDVIRVGSRDRKAQFFVLEDNLRVPSGVSYMIESRRLMTKLLPHLYSQHSVSPVEHYPEYLLSTLHEMAPKGVLDPNVVVLTPGIYNSAYFEHSFLARQMGAYLVEGKDLFVEKNKVWMQTMYGPKPVHVIYRRIDDDYLDPKVFRRDSTLGVSGLMSAYLAGNVTVCNAVGTGVADDKSIYPYVDEMIRFYLGEEPILQNIPTWLCRTPSDLKYVMAHLDELVVKEVHGAGGYGMLIGPKASKSEIDDFRKRIAAHPERYIAQPTLALSTCPIAVDEGLAPRHVDLRPFVLQGAKTRIVEGGLTRVALKSGSLVVNSSQGGGVKDTWIIR